MHSLKNRFLRIGIPALIFVTSLCVFSAQAQERGGETVAFSLLSVDTLQVEAGEYKRFVIDLQGKTMRGFLLKRNKKLTLSYPDQPVLELPHKLETLVSRDGKTILQYGDEVIYMHPQRTDLYWLNEEGEMIRRLQNYYAGKALVSMSDDGYTAVAGPLYQNTDSLALSLYSPVGERIWELYPFQGQRVAWLGAMSGGRGVVVQTTDEKDWLTGHEIQIREGEGELTGLASELGIIQKITIVGDGEQLFVQGFNSFSLVRIAAGEVIWTRPGKVRMISPYGAAMSPAGDILFLLLADWQGKSQEAYRWNLTGLNALDGQEVGHTFLPQSYPSTWERVFEQITPDQLQIFTPQQILNYKWVK